MANRSAVRRSRARRPAGLSRRLAQYSAGTLALAGSTTLAHADFSGMYTLVPPASGILTLTAGNQTFGTWTSTTTFYGGTTAVANLNDSSAPTSFTLNGTSNTNGSQVSELLLHTATVAGTFSFSYSANGSGGEYTAAYVVNGSYTFLNSTSSMSSGTITNIAVGAGQSFGFYNSTGYGSPAALTISNFSANVPEPGPIGWIAAGAAGLLATRALRRRMARATLPA